MNVIITGVVVPVESLSFLSPKQLKKVVEAQEIPDMLAFCKKNRKLFPVKDQETLLAHKESFRVSLPQVLVNVDYTKAAKPENAARFNEMANKLVALHTWKDGKMVECRCSFPKEFYLQNKELCQKFLQGVAMKAERKNMKANFKFGGYLLITA